MKKSARAYGSTTAWNDASDSCISSAGGGLTWLLSGGAEEVADHRDVGVEDLRAGRRRAVDRQRAARTAGAFGARRHLRGRRSRREPRRSRRRRCRRRHGRRRPLGRRRASPRAPSADRRIAASARRSPAAAGRSPAAAPVASPGRLAGSCRRGRKAARRRAQERMASHGSHRIVLRRARDASRGQAAVARVCGGTMPWCQALTDQQSLASSNQQRATSKQVR